MKWLSSLVSKKKKPKQRLGLKLTDAESFFFQELGRRTRALPPGARDYWNRYFDVKRTLKKLMDARLIELAPDIDRFADTYRVPEIKTMLKERGLVAKGLKKDLLALVESHFSPEELHSLVQDVELYLLTDIGREVLGVVEKQHHETEKQRLKEIELERNENNRQSLDSYREAGVVSVEIFAGGRDTSCPSCKALSGTIVPIDKAQVPPNPYCTHEMGCRCTYLGVFNDLD